MGDMKDFFHSMARLSSAGLAVEEAREVRERARNDLRKVAAERCPEELAALDRASDVVKAAEERLVEAFKGVGAAQYNVAHAMLHDHGISCGDETCPRNVTYAAGTKVN